MQEPQDKSMIEPLSMEEMNDVAGGDWDLAMQGVRQGLVNGMEGAVVGTVVGGPGWGTAIGFGVGFVGGLARVALDLD